MSTSRGAVLFDLDGVLVDSRAAITECINHALAAHGLRTHAETALLRFIGPPLGVTFSELTGQASDSDLVLSCVTAYRARYVEVSLRVTTVVPGIADALAELARHRRLAVATSKAVAFAEPLLTALGLRDFFTVVAAPELNAHSEGKSVTIGAALAALDPERAVMVGDRSFDIAGAHARALPAIGVTWGIGDHDELTAAGADAVINAPHELPAAVERLTGPGRGHWSVAIRRRQRPGAAASGSGRTP